MTGLDMIWSSSLIIAVILVLRKLLGKKCNPNIRYMLWLLVAIRILLPVEFVFEVEEDSFVAAVIETGEVTRAQVVERIVNPSFDEELLRESEERVPNEDEWMKSGYELEDGLTLATKDEIKGSSLEQVQLTKLFGIVWIVGSVSFSLYWLGLNIYNFSKIKMRRIEDVESLIPVYRVEEINGLVGVIRPKIFISAPIVQDEMRRNYVLAHELQHYRVGDHIWQFVRCLCVIAQWFNPFVWIAYFKSQEDCELACDYRVLKELQESEHANYAETLLHILKAGKGRNQVLITAMSNDKKNMKARLEGILKKQNRKPLIGAIVAVVVLAVVVASFLTYQVKEASAESSKYQLKQLEMLDEKCGWAVTTENELIYTENGLSSFEVVKIFDEISKVTEGFIHADFIGENTVYAAYFEAETQKLVVEYTVDKGTNWDKTIIPYREYAKISDAGSVYVSFVDESTGYLLYCSTPAAGQMVKLLFTTVDGGKSFAFVQDLTETIEGYPQGISFVNKQYGYIAVSYHGQEAYLYETADCGSTWKNEKPLEKDNSVSYIDGFAPVFYGEKQWNGILLVKEVSDRAYYKVLTTKDAGASWKLEGIVDVESVRSYAALNNESFYIIDVMGKVNKVAFGEVKPVEKKQENVENDEYSYMILEEYTGYLDEFEHDIYQFEKDDLDGDGLGDRIYKTVQGEDVCNYRLELGNGEKIDLRIEASTYTVPSFEFVDLTGDGKQDIVYKAEPPFTANGGFWILDFVIFVAGESGYEVAQLPFYEGGEVGLSKYLHYEFELVADDMMQVRVPDYDYEVMIPYGENTPLEYYYEAGHTPNYAIDGHSDEPVSGVWDYYVDTTSSPTKVVCCNSLFDKWSVCGLNVVLRYEDGTFVVEEILFDENVYDEESYSEEEAIELLREQLILAYNNIYGEFVPSDVEPTLYSGDKERYAYLIPRIEVSEETETYYSVQFIREFRIDKKTGQIMVYYNGIDPLLYEFDPMDESALAFAG